MKTLFNIPDRNEVLDRLTGVRPESQRRWGSMSAHQMICHLICHLGDSFRAALGEKQLSQSTTFFKRTIYKWAALRLPFIGLTESRHGLRWTSTKVVRHLPSLRPI
jgi:hypothetical protein